MRPQDRGRRLLLVPLHTSNCATAFMPSLFTSSVPLAFASFLPDIHHLTLNNLHILTSNALASCAHADSTDNSALHPPAQSAPSINFAVRRRNDRHETSPSFLSQVTLTTRPLLDHRCRLLMLSRQRLQTGLQLARAPGVLPRSRGPPPASRRCLGGRRTTSRPVQSRTHRRGTGRLRRTQVTWWQTKREPETNCRPRRRRGVTLLALKTPAPRSQPRR